MEFTIGETRYKAGKISAFKQMFIAKRLAPAVGELSRLANLDESMFGIELNDDGSLKNFALKCDIREVVAPFTEALAALKDEDLEFVFNKFLEATETYRNGGWAFMRVNGATMFEPDLPELVQIGFHVFKANLANFTKSLSSNSVLKAVARKMKEKEAEAQA